MFLFDIIVLFAIHAERLVYEEEKTIKREGIKKIQENKKNKINKWKEKLEKMIEAEKGL